MATKFKFLIVLLFSFGSIKAADFYWVGGSGNWSDFTNHWATTSGGSTFHASLPTNNDDVYFDANSFSSGGQTVTLNLTLQLCRNMDWSASMNAPDFAALDASRQLHVYGSLILSDNMTWNLNNFLFMRSTTTGNIIQTYGAVIESHVDFEGTGGEWTIQDSLILGEFKELDVIAGELITNNNKLQSRLFRMENCSGPCTLTAGTSDIYITGGWRTGFVNSFGILNTDNCALHFLWDNDNTPVVIKTGQNFRKVVIDGLYNGSGSYVGVNLKGGHVDSIFAVTNLRIRDGGDADYAYSVMNVQVLDQNTTIGHLNVDPGATVSIADGITLTTDNLDISGTPAMPVSLNSTTFGVSTGISSSSGTICVENVYLTDIAATGGASFVGATGTLNIANSTGWTFQPGSTCSVITSVDPNNTEPVTLINTVGTESLLLDRLDDVNFQISTLNGQVLSSGSTTGSVDISNLNAGYYILNIQSQTDSRTYKILKQ